MVSIGSAHWPWPARRPILLGKEQDRTGPATENQRMTTLTQTVRERAQDALLATGAALYFGGFLLSIETALERLMY